jgi:hypothetical protein
MEMPDNLEKKLEKMKIRLIITSNVNQEMKDKSHEIAEKLTIIK